MDTPRVLVVGAGISGVACARALRAAGIAARLVERVRVVGGRMATRRIDGRRVDLGASYFTVPEGSGFADVVDGWAGRGLARCWTARFRVADAGVLGHGKDGPERWAAPDGLRSLVVDLADGLDLRTDSEVRSVELDAEAAVVDGEHFDAVVLAMPDPQAARLLDAPASSVVEGLDPDTWESSIAVVLGWAERVWDADLRGVFVNGSSSISFIGDDGDRRGDGAAVLVAHTTDALAREHLGDPDAVIAPVADEVRSILGIREAPGSSHAHRWTFARPVPPHPEPFLLDGPIGVCGDGWGGSSSVSAAWTSGDALGRELAARLS